MGGMGPRPVAETLWWDDGQMGQTKEKPPHMPAASAPLGVSLEDGAPGR